MRLFIHCGLHKTGSTALQTALVQMAPSLADRGVSFPSYQPDEPFAHHWLAGALKGPHVYKSAQDNIARMIDVARSSDPHTVCFSSEDFETHLRHPKALARLLKIADRLQATPVFLIYLRNQVEYLESLYLQFLRMGLRLDASEMIDEVIETGQFKWRKWIIQFDYAAMIAALEATNAAIVVRSYHALENNCIVQDFLRCIGQPAALKPQEATARRNAARLGGNIQRFARNRDSTLDPDVVARFDKMIEGRRPRLSAQAQENLKQRFQDGNRNIETQFGIQLNHRFARPAAPEPIPVIDRIFETGTLDYLAGLGTAAQSPQGGPDDIELPADWLARV